jgi:hypothetical protein
MLFAPQSQEMKTEKLGCKLQIECFFLFFCFFIFRVKVRVSTNDRC